MLKRKSLYAVLGVVGVLVILLGAIGAVYAQGPRPPVDDRPFDGECPYYEDGGYARRGRMRPGRGMGGFSLVDGTAEATGLTEEEVVAALREGQTFAEIAEAQGVDPRAIVDRLLAERKELLEEAVAEGRLTQERADEMLEEMAEHLSEHLEEGWTDRHGADGDHSFGGRRGRPGAGFAPRVSPRR
ncbi:MAG TPA: hypothetical protein EYH30_09035 [Anaerolineales bacterium]|nr:hypothetical protein [Anaerolineae bacterium]HIQ02255.1 hypothetical protein [Anaerolineales bacterium]